MKKNYIIFLLLSSFIISQECDLGFTSIDDGCYFQNDLDVLDQFIYNSSGSINMILDSNNNGIIESLELCSQNWENGRIIKFDCNPIVNIDGYNWINISGEMPGNISNWSNIEEFLIPYNDISGIVPENICDLNLDFSNNNVFDLTSNSLCPPYPECIEPFVGSQSNWGTGSCELGNCYDFGVEDVAIIEFNGDNLLNPAQDPYGVGTILASLHNAGPSCSQYPGLMITTDTPGVTFPYATSYEAEGQIVNWWYAIFAGDTYFSSTTFEVSPFIPQGTEINFTIETVTMGCYEEDCIDDPYCHECPLTPAVSLNLVIGEQYPNMLGDANLDGDVNIVDIIEAINFILYVEDIYNEGNMFLFNLINMNDDNTINILDVILMVDYILSN